MGKIVSTGPNRWVGSRLSVPWETPDLKPLYNITVLMLRELFQGGGEGGWLYREVWSSLRNVWRIFLSQLMTLAYAVFFKLSKHHRSGAQLSERVESLGSHRGPIKGTPDPHSTLSYWGVSADVIFVCYYKSCKLDEVSRYAKEHYHMQTEFFSIQF